MTDESIAQLKDMGFDEEVARQALVMTNNDVTGALSYLFGDGIPKQQQGENEDTQHPEEKPNQRSDKENDQELEIESDHVQNTDIKLAGSSSSSLSPPPLPSREIHLDEEIRTKIAAYGSLRSDEPGVIEEDSDIEDDDDMSSVDSSDDYTVYDDPSATQRNSYIPPILVPINYEYFESYLAPLIITLHEIPSFRNLIFKLESFNDYGYEKNWWKDKDIKIAGSVGNRFVMELQRVVAFLDNAPSKRFFASIHNLVQHLSKDLLAGLNDMEGVEDFFPAFFKSLSGAATGVDNEKLQRLFQSEIIEIYNGEEREKQVVECFTIEPDVLKCNIYQTFHKLLWENDFERLGMIHINRLSEVMVIPILGNLNESVYGSFSVSEIFYPQIYLKENEQLMRSKIELRQELINQRLSNSKKIMDISSYQGKRVNDFLSTTVEYLQNKAEDEEIHKALQNINQIKDNIIKEKLSITDQQNAIVEKLNSNMDLFNIPGIVKEEKLDWEPYFLTSIVLDTSNIYYFTKNFESKETDYCWYQVRYFHREHSKRVSNFNIRKIMDFSEIQNTIHEFTRSGISNTMTLTYVKRSAFFDEDPLDVLPNNLVKFFNRDNEQLAENLRENSDEESEVIDLTRDSDSYEEFDSSAESNGESARRI
ncbi:UBA domain-containing protein RUP1 [Komagataella phaffii CBS 7435]|uniref:UBA domain-containing protein n=2 Tax=Komagataella phaffii TaxID=460519 RepID=C4R3M5_KOMPG|nr:Hypothetical protein PAS_chr3_0132 [Komagataella phaffii GS115]AOA63899.1 GQ67_03149T0 [Komagataella phaffii]CAH2450183.1 UBA domain-containing protein RUP1 [Komagataella phaffii CBS 7435]AOA69313.1 GQ68_03133T0 [Komagataella phaffii GS115]CAY70072.1 Hypothetical protein PAS_chr3_0132 [Komagataella phaffii GS115]CCA40048.1 UBA domain-containing protein RUP1 [Komagataella phaffii CBS 7435]